MGKNETNLEKHLRGKSPEEQYGIIYWLMYEFGRSYASSEQARIDWIKGDIKEDPTNEAKRILDALGRTGN